MFIIQKESAKDVEVFIIQKKSMPRMITSPLSRRRRVSRMLTSSLPRRSMSMMFITQKRLFASWKMERRNSRKLSLINSWYCQEEVTQEQFIVHYYV